MNINFAAMIARLGAGAAFRIMNAARPAADYLFNTFLPEQLKPTYNAKSGNMTVRSVMAGLVGTDSPYPPTGLIDAGDFNEQTAKLANRVTLGEMAQRELQALMQSLGGNTAAGEALVQQTGLNFLDKLITQAHLDAMEYLRGMALSTLALDWTFGERRLQVDYTGGLTGQILTNRTGAAGYGGASSTFWTDYRAARSLLKNQVRAIIAHPETIDMIISNSVNNILVTKQDLTSGTTEFVKNVGTGGALVASPDARDRTSIIGYGLEGEVIDPTTPGIGKAVPFMPRGKIILIGNPIPRGFQVGQGSTPSGQNEMPVGYTHIGPTVEGGGHPGRWADLRTPDDSPWVLEGRGVTNGLPVIEAPEKIVVLRTAMS